MRREVRWRGSKAKGLSASETEAIRKEWDFQALPAESEAEGALGADGVGFGVEYNKFDRLMLEKWRERERLLDPVVQGIYDEETEKEGYMEQEKDE